MKNILLQLKTLAQKLGHKFKKHEVSIYICSGLTVLFLSILFLQDIKHTKENLKHQKVIVDLESQVTEDFDLFMEVQQTMREEQHKSYLLQEKIYEQNNFIRQLIIYLKKIKHWPPKSPPEPPVDPNTLAESI